MYFWSVYDWCAHSGNVGASCVGCPCSDCESTSDLSCDSYNSVRCRFGQCVNEVDRFNYFEQLLFVDPQDLGITVAAYPWGGNGGEATLEFRCGGDVAGVYGPFNLFDNSKVYEFAVFNPLTCTIDWLENFASIESQNFCPDCVGGTCQLEGCFDSCIEGENRCE